jgi:hypothetical protein
VALLQGDVVVDELAEDRDRAGSGREDGQELVSSILSKLEVAQRPRPSPTWPHTTMPGS